MTARTIAKVLTETKAVDKPVSVENKPGGGGTVFMAEYATKDVKDNYKLFVSSPPILINHLKKEGNTPYGYNDTTPLAQLTKDYGAVAVAANSKYKDLKSLLDDMKADPTKITVAGGSAPGSMDHLVSILPAFKYGIDPKKVKYVSYDGGGESCNGIAWRKCRCAWYGCFVSGSICESWENSHSCCCSTIPSWWQLEGHSNHERTRR